VIPPLAVTGAGPVALIAGGAGAASPGPTAEMARVIAGECALPFLAEPAGGDPRSSALGRTLALLSELDPGLAGDVIGRRWVIGGQRSGPAGVGHVARTSRRLLRDDLEILGESLADARRPVLIRLTGPITLAASVDDLRGRALLADPVARADLATALAEALVAGVTLAGSILTQGAGGIVLLCDESGLARALAGRTRASAFTVTDPIPPERLASLISPTVQAVRQAAVTDRVVLDVGATPGALAVGLAVDPGGLLLPVDRQATGEIDALTAALDAGVHILGTVRTTADDARDPGLIATRVRRVLRTVGLPDEEVPGRLWLAADPTAPPSLPLRQGLTCLRSAADRLAAVGEPLLSPGAG